MNCPWTGSDCLFTFCRNHVLGVWRGMWLFALFVYYRPQRSCGKVMFLHVSVILFTRGRWVSIRETPLDRPPPRRQRPTVYRKTPRQRPPWTDTPQTETPWKETPLDRDPPTPYGNERAVRILLECILVFFIVCLHFALFVYILQQSRATSLTMNDTPRGSWASSIFDLRNSQSDPMLPNLLERINPDEMDQHNLAQRHLSRQDAIFSLYRNQPIVSVVLSTSLNFNRVLTTPEFYSFL